MAARDGSGLDESDRTFAALMRATQDGDRPAYLQLLHQCEPIIRRAARRTGVASDRIDDVVQDTLLTLHGARHTFDPSRSFTAWLGVIAQRRAIDVLRRSGRSGRREVHAPQAYESYADETPGAVRLIENAGRARDLAAAITTLSPLQREAVERLALREQTLAEASADTGRSAGALKVNLHRAIKALRARLVETSHTDPSHAEPSHAGPSHSEPSHAEPSSAPPERRGEERNV